MSWVKKKKTNENGIRELAKGSKQSYISKSNSLTGLDLVSGFGLITTDCFVDLLPFSNRR